MKDRLFGTSGIRGVVNEDTNPELFLNLSKSIATELGEPGEILIGRDTRLSGKLFENSLIGGFLSTGCDVKKIGIVPTPVLGFSVNELNADAGVMVTASHNPPEYNGVKIFNSDGMAISSEKEKKIEKIHFNRYFNLSEWNKLGKVSKANVLKDYLTQIARKISIEEEYKIIIDCANGPASKTTPPILERLGCEVMTINSNLDGTFPGRSPEPTAENIRDLGRLVKTTDADLGIAHDGDGDRIAAVDENGQFVNQDKLLALMGSYSVKEFGGEIVSTVDASKIVDEQISKIGGDVTRTKVGDVYVAQEMNSVDSKFGGEPSGTWIHGDIHMCPDGTLAAARIIKMLDDEKKKFSELTNSLPSYPIMRTKISCPDEKKQEKMKLVEEKAPSFFEGVEEIIKTDGIRLEFENGDWILIRPSGTEPYIRITAEADNEKEVKKIVETGRKLLKKV